MPTQGVFSNIAVPSGSINILYRTINGEDHIKAITVSDEDIQDNDPKSNIGLSLEQLETIRLPLSSSGELTSLRILSVTKKNGYHFLDVVNTKVDTLAAFTTASIAITPFLEESFFYNDYNALISNASEPETSFLRYDVDRTAGQVSPSNFNAIAGVGSLTISDMVYLNTNEVGGPAEVISYTSTAFIAPLTSSLQAFHNNRDVDIKVLEPQLIDNLGLPQEPVFNIVSSWYNNSSFVFYATSSLSIEVDDTPDFDNSNNNFVSGTIAEQRYSNGTTYATYTPFSTSVPSGSMTGDYVYVRLRQINKIGYISSTSPIINVSPYIYTNPATPNYLNIGLYYADQQPYAPPAPVQDSNYTTTGIINARYNGTKTGEDDFSGIEPAVAAKPLEAALYRSAEDNGFICSQSLSDRDIVPILFEGPTEFPTSSLALLGYINAPVSTSNQETINIQGLVNRQPQPGDIIEVSTEQMLVKTVTRTLSLIKIPHYDLLVTRAYGGTSALSSINAGTQITRYSGARLLTIDKSRLIAVSDKKVWLKDNRNIIKTNDRGFVIEISEVCSV